MPQDTRYERVLDLALEMAVMDPAQVDYGWMAQLLLASLECPVAIFSAVGPEGIHGRGWPEAQLPAATVTDLIRRCSSEHPLIQHYVKSNDRRPLAISGLMPLQSWRASAIGSDMHAVTGFYEHMAIPLQSSPGTMRAFMLGRGEGGFTSQERDFVERIHPSLVTLDYRARAVRSPKISPLTRREKEVLELIAAGLSRQASARQLQVSIRTIDKHLESIYRKFGVNSHLQAVLAARRLH
jgi:DNA-binding CsgD family transcriptional regulator